MAASCLMSERLSLSLSSLTSILSGLLALPCFDVPYRKFPLVCCSFRLALLDVARRCAGFLSPSTSRASSNLDCLM